MTKPVVEVLLSTFNAGEYLVPLLESVWSQDGVDVRVHVRDDGSTDGTREAVAHLAGERVVAVELGSHVGPCQSYFRLLSAARVDGAYVAFCDQDDLWLPGKLWRAVSLLEGSARQPSMYCGRLTFADAELNPVGLSPLPRRKLSLSNALVENVAPGPTMVINTKGRELITNKLPAYAIMHDAWSYLVFSALGNIVYDIEPYVLYRIHDRNHMGVQRNRLARLYRAARYRLNGYTQDHIMQAREFARLFGDEVSSGDGRILRRFCEDGAGWPSVLSYAIRPDVYRQSGLDDLILRAVLVGRKARGARGVDRCRTGGEGGPVEEGRRPCP